MAMSKLCLILNAEFENIVTITEQPMPVMAGESLVLRCIVRSDDPAIVQWLDPNGVSITNDGFMFVDGPFIDGNKTTTSLYFSPLHTSRAGVYVCHSDVMLAESVESASHSVTIQSKFYWVSMSEPHTSTFNVEFCLYICPYGPLLYPKSYRCVHCHTAYNALAPTLMHANKVHAKTVFIASPVLST